MDNFEKHIIKNKEQFNDQTVDKEKLWARIGTELKQQQTVIPLWKLPRFKIAASIIILLTIGGVIGVSLFGSNQMVVNEFASQELMEIDSRYKGLVSQHVKLVKDHSELSERDKTEFLSFMDELDVEYDELKLEMKNNLDNELVLAAIVSNYKKRIELIENLLKQINESKIINEDDYGYTL